MNTYLHTCKCGSDDVNVVNLKNNAILKASQEGKPPNQEELNKLDGIVKATCKECGRTTTKTK